MAGRGEKNRQRGFTLVELLIAIFIFAIVISSVYGAYRFSFTVIYGSEARLLISRNARVAMGRITADLDSVVAGPGGALRGERLDQQGARGDSLAFISTAHLVLSKDDVFTGYTLIRYSVERDADSGLLNLYRSDTVLLPGAEAGSDEVRRDILGQGLKEVAFTYLDKDGNDADEWRSERERTGVSEGEEEKPLLPALVYVKLTFAESSESEGGTVFRSAVALPQQAENSQ